MFAVHGFANKKTSH